MRVVPLSATKRVGAHCYLLEVEEGYHVLLDCGWTDAFDADDLSRLAAAAPHVRAVLLSHGDVAHAGALPVACARLGLPAAAAVLATVPVHRMGQLALYDAHQSALQRAPFAAFSLDDVDAAFDRVTQVRFLQRCSLPGTRGGVEVTAYPAGHSLGGSVWRVQSETDDVVYAADFCHTKDRHLNGTVLETIRRPSLLVADAAAAQLQRQQLPSRKQRDRELFDALLGALRGGGNVLMPVDTAGRALELALCVDQQWAAMRLGGTFGVALLTNCAYSTVDFAKSQLEWMSDAVSRGFDATRENPFDFKHVRLASSVADIASLPRPCCVLASGCSLAPGFARDLFAEWAPLPASLVLFTDRSYEGSLARRIIESLPNPPPSIKLELGWSTFVEEEDEGKEEEKKMGDEDSAAAAAAIKVEVEDEHKEAQETEPQAQPMQVESAGAATTTTTPGFHGRVNPLEMGTSATAEQFQAAGFAHPIFPFHPQKQEFDAYGEVINPDLFMTPEERERIAAEERSRAEADAERLRAEEAAAQEAAVQAAQEAAAAASATPHLAVKQKKRAYTSEERTVPLQCQLRFVDMEGRSDAKSLRTIISHVCPRQLVLVHGNAEAQASLAQWCVDNIKLLRSVHCPDTGEAVDATSEMHVFRAVLHDSLVNNASFQRNGDNEVAFVQAQIAEAEAAGLPVLIPAPPPTATDHRWHDTVLLGDPKLYDLSGALAKQGFAVQFDHGALVVNGGRVVVRKTEASIAEEDNGSVFTIEGQLSDEYYRVREIIYSQLVLI